MKYSILLAAALALAPYFLKSQIPGIKEKVAVLLVDTKGLGFEPVQMGNLARLELDKTGVFEVLDPYDVAYLVEKEHLQLENCFGKICLVETGKKLKADKMMTGSVEQLGESIVVSIRLVDIATESVAQSQVIQFLNLKPQIQDMLAVTIQKMLGLPFDENLFKKLTRANDYESSINVPETGRLNLTGSRMGLTMLTGQRADIYRAKKSAGGFDGQPLLFHFGYQFETTYLNSGGLQALFEFIPIISGLNEGRLIPSLNIMHGLRSNKNGFEFAFGPLVYLDRRIDGVYGKQGEWLLESEFVEAYPDEKLPAFESRLDSRGKPTINTDFIIGFGKSFKSGKLNIPVNAFFVPDRDGARYGLSIGFNGRG